ncbi:MULTISPECIES: DMT family transporter [Falsihalocynthiibacter]|uniref:Peptide ABC transporter permease n=1 Tax=Falsihalocynthiibacter arcticus TaxID=1579316 RepID=A0A126UVV9_9RHOB|nr:DMT family transporter [Falsihalocynthiibacter arcticus]AML50007.1 peptide ABC transporter permease [Falsihalocynthiibacter arcticus]
MISAPNNTLTAILWMLVTGLCFIAVTAIVKVVGSDVPAAEAAFLRYLLGLVFLVPMLPAVKTAWKQGALDRSALWLFSLRGVVHTFGVIAWFYAMTQIPIAEVTAMNYMTPIYVTLGAAIFLGEKLAFRRVAAIIVALIGGLIILRPGFREVSPGHIAMVGTALAFAASYLVVGRLAGRISPTVIVAMLSMTVTIGLFPFAMAVWVTPTLAQLALLFLVAGFATAGHFTMTMAFRLAPMAVTQPVTFLQLLWSALLGVVLFSEPVDFWVVVGGILIMASVSFITWREFVLKRVAVKTPPLP